MKALIASSVSLLVGLAIGSYTGYRYYETHITNEAVKQMLEQMESADSEHAAEAVRAIEFIESDESSNAVRLLSRPIANYYQWYAIHAGTDRERELGAIIGRLSSTNHIVADAIRSKAQ
ncbi:MAG: hypothetical protein ABSD58_09470 [Verrucomicrobiia bacterium]|jgi:uncharacterized protein YneF (UPF0154 family)